MPGPASGLLQVTPPTELQMALPHSHRDFVFTPRTVYLREMFSFRLSACPWYMEGMHLRCTTAPPVAMESVDRLVTTPVSFSPPSVAR
jgi:hypothetical protein